MVKRKKGSVQLIHKSSTFNGKKHVVSFGKNLNLPKNNKGFKSIGAARKFAFDKARKIGVRKILSAAISRPDKLITVPKKIMKRRSKK